MIKIEKQETKEDEKAFKGIDKEKVESKIVVKKKKEVEPKPIKLFV